MQDRKDKHCYINIHYTGQESYTEYWVQQRCGTGQYERKTVWKQDSIDAEKDGFTDSGQYGCRTVRMQESTCILYNMHAAMKGQMQDRKPRQERLVIN